MTCRGSRRNTTDKAENIYTDSPEWLAQNQISTRNFIRKWGHFVKHDKYMKPIIPPKYDIGIRMENGNLNLLEAIEPWCDVIYTEESFEIGRAQDYVEIEDGKTLYDMSKRVHTITGNDKFDYNDILIEIDGKTFNQDDYTNIQNIAEIIKESGEIGSFKLGNITINIQDMTEYQNDLIICKN